MQPKKTALHKALKAAHNIHTGKRKANKKVKLTKVTPHLGVNGHSKKSNVGRKRGAVKK